MEMTGDCKLYKCNILQLYLASCTIVNIFYIIISTTVVLCN